MRLPKPQDSATFRRPAVRLALVLSVLFWLVLTRAGWIACRHVVALSDTSDVVASDAVPSAASPTGYEHGLRRTILHRYDAGQWIMQAEMAAESGSFRLRSVGYDNAPAGRDVHWAMPHRLWLLGLGYLLHWTRSVPLGVGIEQAALISGPVFYGLFGAVLMLVAARTCSWREVAMVFLGLIGFSFLRRYFDAVDADHHGMIVATIIGMLGSIHLGLRASAATRAGAATTRPGRRFQPGWMTVAGILGGVGLWLSAASVVPALAATLAGAVVASVLGPRDRAAEQAAAWREWGWAGGLTSLAAYLVEYFPAHLGLRLEVNHPLYGLAWVGVAELLAVAIESKASASVLTGLRQRWARVLAAGLAVGALPVVFVATRRDSFWIGDPFIWRLHRDYLLEFGSLPGLGLDALLEPAVACTALSWLCPVLVLVQMARGRLAASSRERLAVPLVATLVFAALAVAQIRWAGMLCGANLCLLVAWMDEEGARSSVGRPALWKVLGAFGLVAPASLVAMAGLAASVPPITRGELLQLAERSLAYRLRHRLGDQSSAIVLTSPAMTHAFAYFAGLRGLGSLYWENRDGLRRAAAICAAPSVEEARRLIEAAGVTHIVVASWDGFEPHYVRLVLGRSRDDPVPPEAFIMQLVEGGVVPRWLQPVPYRLPVHPAYEGARVWIYEVVPDRARDVAVADEIGCLLESGAVAEARARETELRSYAHSIPALLVLARMIGPERALVEVLPEIERLTRSEPELRLEDRIGFALLLAQAGRAHDARRNLLQCLERMDAAAARRLSPLTLATLRELVRNLDCPYPDPSLEPLIDELIPPYLR